MIERSEIVRLARGWIGTPYRHQASLKGAGTDCLGLIRGLWRELYGGEPEEVVPYSPDWAETGAEETMLAGARRHCPEVAIEAARPGDILLFRWRDGAPAKHAAILATPESIIHAYEGIAVVESPLAGGWRRRIAHAFAFPGAN